MNDINLKKDEVEALALSVGQPVLKFYTRRMDKELKKLDNYSDLNINDFINVSLSTLINLDFNNIMHLKNTFNNLVDIKKIKLAYITALTKTLEEVK